MASPKKTLSVERISYAEEALTHLKDQLHQLFNDVEWWLEHVLKAVQGLEEMETMVDEETFEQVDHILEKAWTESMSVRTRL